MDREDCDFYKATSKKDKLCESFTGDKDNKRHIDNCRRHCSTMEFKEMMQSGDTYKRVHGALRRK